MLMIGYTSQFLIQAFVIVLIGIAAISILLIEKKRSKRLEEIVNVRTEDLKRSEEKYRSLVESAEDFIFTVDINGIVQSMNSFTANFFGGHADEFLGKGLDSFFPEKVADEQAKLIKSVYKYGKSIRDEFEMKIGEYHLWINANFMPLKDENGSVNSILCIARDITENKRLERQLVNAEKLASLGTLAAGVAHEVNNPLGIILGFCDLLIQKAEMGTQEYEDLKTIERQGLHCKQVVENLLSFTRRVHADLEYSNLNESLEEVIGIVHHNLEMNNIELYTDLYPAIPLVRGEARELQQVFLNIINNAIAAMDNGGVLNISTLFDEQNLKASVRFEDNGIGIGKEHADHIFEPFYTTKPEGEGTGLGLFVSYGILKKFGGSIDFISRTGDSLNGGKRGTVFTIKLPIITEAI